MELNTSRLTLFVLLSALEIDLRRFIETYLQNQLDPPLLLGIDLFTKAKERFNKSASTSYIDKDADKLIYYIDFADSFQILKKHNSNLPQSIKALINQLNENFSDLIKIRNRVAHSRPLDFGDFPRTIELLEKLSNQNKEYLNNLSQTFLRLTEEPSYVLNIKIPEQPLLESPPKHNLPQPDTDETGFLGRKTQINDIKKLCAGTFPIITILGDGGVGKTSLAIKVAYDFLESSNNPFDFIIWTSCKTSQLTSYQVSEIKNSIKNSTGLLKKIAIELVGEQTTTNKNDIDEILDYLKEFKILLIIDNLETVLDRKIKSFLGNLPVGSRVLITSRIGLGELEYRYKLQPMEPNESIELLRTLAKSRKIEKITKTSNNVLQKFCEQMNHNPLFIKWFVSCIQIGKRPEEILAKSDNFLDFAMSNVYDYLSKNSKTILTTMLSSQRLYSQAEIAFLSSMEPLDIQKSINELLTTNMIGMESTPQEKGNYESRYRITDLSYKYLIKKHPIKQQHLNMILQKQNELTVAEERMKSEHNKNPYSISSIEMRSKSDSIVAKYLIEALDLSKKTKFEEALQKINIAKILAPNYFEVFKTEAWIEAQNRNSIAAQSAYESALLLEPDSAPLLFFYGGFLLRQMSASDKAREQFIRALEKDPHSFYIKLELLRANLFTKQFTESEPLIKELLVEVNSNNSKVPVWGKKKAHDLTLQYYQRIADFHHVHKDYKVAIDNLEKLKEHYNGISMYLKDQKMKEKLEKSLRTARSCSLCIEDISYKNKAKDIYDWIHSIISNEYNNSYLDEKTASRAEGDGYQSGKITNIQLNKGFGFIRDTNGVDVFLHKSQIGPVFYKLSIGTNVRFKSKEGDKGLSALQVIIVE